MNSYYLKQYKTVSANVISFVVLFTASHTYANAVTLSNRALLHRCYQQLTNTPLKPNDPMLTKVDAGQDPIDVCINDVLKSAYFADDSSGNFVVPNATRNIGKLVTNTFHLLHSSWFFYRNIPKGLFDNTAMNAVFEPNAGAIYYTMTLLDPSNTADYFLQTNDYLRTLRDQGVTASNFYLNTATYNLLNSFLGVSSIIYQTGIPYGVRKLTTSDRVFTTGVQDNYPRGISAYSTNTIKVFENYGGGIMGLDIFLARTFDEEIGTLSDGVGELPRKWSESIYRDLMCLDLPVVRLSDAEAFVEPNSHAEFRRTAACTTCHASTDRMAGVIKSYAQIERRNQSIWTTWIDTARWNKGAAGDYSWSSNYRTTATNAGTTYSNYIKEDHVGYLYYRGYDGRLVNEKIDSIPSLGFKMSQQIEPYLCAAKRYYRFFTGIDVAFKDPGLAPLPMKPEDAAHYNFVLDITKDLINADQTGVLHPRKMSTLIEAILKSPQYKLSDFGAPHE